MNKRKVERQIRSGDLGGFGWGLYYAAALAGELGKIAATPAGATAVGTLFVLFAFAAEANL